MATAKPLEGRLERRIVRVELQPAAQPPTLPATVGAFRIAGGFRAWDLYEDHTPSCSTFTWAPRAPTTHWQVQEQRGEGIRLTVLATNINSVTATDPNPIATVSVAHEG